MRSFRYLIPVFLLAIAALLAPAVGFAFERNTDRPGGDYTSSDVPGNDPRLCVARCEFEGQCLA